MQKIAPEAEIKNPDEEVKSSQESDEAKVNEWSPVYAACLLLTPQGQPRSNISAGEHAQGDAPRKEPANNAPAVKLDDPDVRLLFFTFRPQPDLFNAESRRET